jgi:hypothetical protein
MQPPQIKEPMKHYIQNLRKISKDLQLYAKEKQDTNCANWEPIEAQIKRWWFSLPPIMQQRRFQITEIASHCRGKFLERPALREVASALRSLGWREVRDWTKSGRNLRQWLPP